MAGRALNKNLIAPSKLILTHCASPKFIYGQQGKKSNKGQEGPETELLLATTVTSANQLLALSYLRYCLLATAYLYTWYGLVKTKAMFHSFGKDQYKISLYVRYACHYNRL